MYCVGKRAQTSDIKPTSHTPSRQRHTSILTSYFTLQMSITRIIEKQKKNVLFPTTINNNKTYHCENSEAALIVLVE